MKYRKQNICYLEWTLKKSYFDYKLNFNDDVFQIFQNMETE